MKKLLTIALLLAFAAGSAFAGATTVTKEMSQANYPGVLVPGSMTGSNVFVADIALMANTALFEYIGTEIGLIALKTDFGIIGVSLSPRENPSLSGIGVDLPDRIFGLQYVTPMGGMNLGLGILYGVETSSFEEKEDNFPSDSDKRNDMDQYLGLKAGASLKGDMPMDIGLNLAFLNETQTLIDYNASGVQIDKDIIDDSKIHANIGARIGLGKDKKAVVTVDYVTGQQKHTYVNEGTNEDYDNIYTNSRVGISALVGKDIKASDTLTVKLATGATFNTSENSLYKVVNRIADTTTYPTATSFSQVYYGIPLNVAVEGKLNDTWTITGGVGTELLYGSNSGNKSKTDATSSTYEDDDISGSLVVEPTLNYALGLCGKFGDLKLEMQVNPYVLLAGPYFITGQSSGDLNWAVALSYDWK